MKAKLLKKTYFITIKQRGSFYPGTLRNCHCHIIKSPQQHNIKKLHEGILQ